MADIEPELQALRGQILRVKSELEALAEAESVLSEKLRTLGLDESVTTVDLPTIAGLPSRRKKSRPPPAAPSSPPWAPAAVGAGLLLGVAIVVLLAMNLQAAKRVEPTLVAAPPAIVSVVPVPVPSPPPPPPPPTPTSASPVSVSAEPPKSEMGTLSIICTPRCDSITDNGVALSPGNLVALPVPAGPHKVVASFGATKRQHSVTVAPGQTRELRIDLEHPNLDRGF